MIGVGLGGQTNGGLVVGGQRHGVGIPMNLGRGGRHGLHDLWMVGGVTNGGGRSGLLPLRLGRKQSHGALLPSAAMGAVLRTQLTVSRVWVMQTMGYLNNSLRKDAVMLPENKEVIFLARTLPGVGIMTPLLMRALNGIPPPGHQDLGNYINWMPEMSPVRLPDLRTSTGLEGVGQV